MLVSPAEHHPLLAGLGEYSSECEKRGVDFLIVGAHGLVGVQRKEIRDLYASLHDGRLARELTQMEGSDLVKSVILIEGDDHEPVLGHSGIYAKGMTRAQYYGLLLSLQVEHNLTVLWTRTIAETAELLCRVETWFEKKEHGSLLVRPKSKAVYGSSRLEEFRLHVWQTFPGISIGWAKKLDAHFGGVLPLRWTCDWDTEQIKGVGPKKTAALKDALDGTDH